jgi:hypothetical protein
MNQRNFCSALSQSFLVLVSKLDVSLQLAFPISSPPQHLASLLHAIILALIEERKEKRKKSLASIPMVD